MIISLGVPTLILTPQFPPNFVSLLNFIGTSCCQWIKAFNDRRTPTESWERSYMKINYFSFKSFNTETTSQRSSKDGVSNFTVYTCKWRWTHATPELSWTTMVSLPRSRQVIVPIQSISRMMRTSIIFFLYSQVFFIKSSFVCLLVTSFIGMMIVIFKQCINFVHHNV